jgi:hypothetical protein
MDLDRMVEQVKRVEYLGENDLKRLCEYVRAGGSTHGAGHMSRARAGVRRAPSIESLFESAHRHRLLRDAL